MAQRLAKGVTSGEMTDAKIDQMFGDAVATVAPVSAPPAGDLKFWQMPPLDAPKVPYIYAAMNAAMQEIRAVGKSGYNEQQRYNFRGIDGVVNAAGPAFRKHGIVPVPRLIQVDYRDTKTTGGKDTREVTVQVEYLFLALDGSSLTVTVPGESLDQSDKGTAKAMSVAYRIALLQMLAIPTDEPDPDASYHTRDGKGEIAPSVAKYILERVDSGPLEGLPALWAIVLDHAAADRTAFTDDSGTLTWFEAFTKRWVGEIGAIETFEQGKAVYDAAKAAEVLGWRVGNGNVSTLLQERSKALTERSTAAMVEVNAAISAANNIGEIGAAEALLIEYAGRKVIVPPRIAEIRTDLDAKRAALEAAANTAGEDTTP